MDDVLQIPAVNLSKIFQTQRKRLLFLPPGGGQLFYSMHVNNRLYDQVKEQVDSMRCRLVRAQKQRLNCWVF